jgi:hypothetical protein
MRARCVPSHDLLVCDQDVLPVRCVSHRVDRPECRRQSNATQADNIDSVTPPEIATSTSG